MLRPTIWLAATLWLLSSTAQADGAIPSIYAGLVGGVGVSMGGEDDIKPYGIAIGARAGLTIPMTDVYVGALGLYHIGEEINVSLPSVDAMGNPTTDNIAVSHSSLFVGGEGGYEFSFGPLVLRPSLGIGLASLFVSDLDFAGDASITEDASALYLSPGVNFMIAMGILLGAEVRYNAVFTERMPDSVSLLGTLGLAI